MNSPAIASWISLFTVLFVSLEAPAQYREARSWMERVNGMVSDLGSDRERTPSMELARSMAEAASRLKDAMSNGGARLADADGSFRDERSKIRRSAATVRGQAEVTQSAVISWNRLLERNEDARSERDNVRRQVSELVSAWKRFADDVEWTRRWLLGGINDTGRIRQEIIREAGSRERAQTEAYQAFRAAEEALGRAVATFTAAGERLRAAETREDEAAAAWNAAFSAGNQGIEAENRLVIQWHEATQALEQAGRAHSEARRPYHDAGQNLDRASARLAETTKQLASWLRESAGSVVKLFNEFNGWNRLFAADFGT